MSESNSNKNKVTIEKFSGSFSNQKGGCTIIVNSTINSLTNVYSLAIYSYLICRPDTWELNAKQLAFHFKCGKNTIYKALKTLMDMNLLTREDIREKGKFLKSHYTLYDKPQLDKGISPYHSTRDTVSRDTVLSDAYITKNIQNKDYKNNNNNYVEFKKVEVNEEKGQFKEEHQFFIDEQLKKGYVLPQAKKALMTILASGSFEFPKKYKENKENKENSILKSPVTPKEIEEISNRGWLERMKKYIDKKEKDGSLPAHEIEKLRNSYNLAINRENKRIDGLSELNLWSSKGECGEIEYTKGLAP